MNRVLVRLGLLAAAIVLANVLAVAFVDWFALEVGPARGSAMRWMVLAAAVTYAVLLAIPFVPGAEIGLALLGMFGPPVVPLVYGATLAGLSLSYLVGRLVPVEASCAACRRLGLRRLAELVERGASDVETARLLDVVPGRLGRLAMRRRLLTLAILLNVPGNVLIGGGGGLALLAGLSRLYAPPAFFATVVLATAPVPLAVLVFGRAPFG